MLPKRTGKVVVEDRRTVVEWDVGFAGLRRMLLGRNGMSGFECWKRVVGALST